MKKFDVRLKLGLLWVLSILITGLLSFVLNYFIFFKTAPLVSVFITLSFVLLGMGLTIQFLKKDLFSEQYRGTATNVLLRIIRFLCFVIGIPLLIAGIIVFVLSIL